MKVGMSSVKKVLASRPVKIARNVVLAGTFLYGAAKFGRGCCDAFDLNAPQKCNDAKIELRDSLGLSTEKFAALSTKRDAFGSDAYWIEARDSVAKAELIKRCKTPKQFDSLMTLIQSGKKTLTQVLKGLK